MDSAGALYADAPGFMDNLARPYFGEPASVVRFSRSIRKKILFTGLEPREGRLVDAFAGGVREVS